MKTPIYRIKFHSLGERSGADTGMAELLTDAGWHETSPEEADVIIFNGGADIGTSIYGEQPVHRSIPVLPSLRDKQEMDIFNKFEGKSKLLVGICRGAQLLNCLNGGTLWQHVNNHGRSHQMTVLASGRSIRITSTHHQMMRPNRELGQVLAVADEATEKFANPDEWTTKSGTFYLDDHKDTEIVWYKNTNSLCIQGHPEYVPGSEFATFCLDLITHYLEEVCLEKTH